MFNIKKFCSLQFTYICLNYKILNVLNNLLETNCSEQDSTNDNIIGDFFSESIDNFSIDNDDSFKISFCENREELNTSDSYLNEQQQNSQFNLINGIVSTIEPDTLVSTDLPLPQDLKMCESKLIFENSSQDLSTFYEKYLPDGCITDEEDQDDERVVKKMKIDNYSKFSASNSFLNITPSEYTQTTPNVITLAQQAKTFIVPYCNNGENNNFNSYQRIYERPYNIITPSCSTGHLSNTSNSEEDMYISVTEARVINRSNPNTFVEQIYNNLSVEDLYNNRHVLDISELPETAVQILPDYNFPSMNPNTNTNSCFKNKHMINHTIGIQNKDVQMTDYSLIGPFKQEKEKNIQQPRIYKPVVNAANPMLPNKLNELKCVTKYNVSIQISLHDKNIQRNFEKIFILEIEQNISPIKKEGRLCRKIIYTISSIPKIFIPVFYEGKEILFSNIQNILQKCEFFYSIRRTITIQDSEKLQEAYLVPHLKLDKNTLWKSKYLDIIRGWKYGPSNFEERIKFKVFISNIKGRIKRTEIRYFLADLPNISRDVEITNSNLKEIFDKILDLDSHIKHILELEYTIEGLKDCCIGVCEFRKRFFATGKIEPPLQELSAREVQVLAVYNKIYHNYAILSNSLLNCYNEFLKEDNEDILE